MSQTKTNIDAMKEQIVADIDAVRSGLSNAPVECDEAMASIETFVAIALRVMSTVNPSKIKAAMIAVEIQARMDGKKVYE